MNNNNFDDIFKSTGNNAGKSYEPFDKDEWAEMKKIEREYAFNTIDETLENIKSILAEAGLGMDNIIKTVVFIKDMNDFAKVNAIYSQYINGEILPARSCVEVARLPKDALVEIEAIAVR